MTPTSPLARSFLNSPLPIEELRGQALLLLSREDLPQIVEGPAIDTAKFVHKIHQVYLIVGVQEKDVLYLFGKFYKTIKQLPDSVSLSTELEKSDTIPMAQEGFLDIWPGRCKGARVAIKLLRTSSPHNLEEVKVILRERALTWKKLDHPNIAAFYGVANDVFRVGLVYDWDGNGDILRYVNLHPGLPRLAPLLQVAKGLHYLHSLDLPHGNLRPKNVLVSDSGHVWLTDYGLAPLNANPNLTAVLPGVGNVRWLAPEIITPPSSATNAITESKPADIFAFGILSMEVFTGQPPFGDSSDLEVSLQILKGARPEFPRDAEAIGLTTDLQGLLRRCWVRGPAQRATIEEVVTFCDRLLGNLHSQPTPPPVELVAGIADPLYDVRQPLSSRRGIKWWKKYSCGLW